MSVQLRFIERVKMRYDLAKDLQSEVWIGDSVVNFCHTKVGIMLVFRKCLKASVISEHGSIYGC